MKKGLALVVLVVLLCISLAGNIVFTRAYLRAHGELVTHLENDILEARSSPQVVNNATTIMEPPQVENYPAPQPVIVHESMYPPPGSEIRGSDYDRGYRDAEKYCNKILEDRGLRFPQ
jgi:hypothetical protein